MLFKSQNKSVFSTDQRNRSQSDHSKSEPKPGALKNSTSLVSLGKRFSQDENGNIAMMFGVSALLMFVFAGLAVDFTRYNLINGDLIESMDAAGLAIAQYQQLNADAGDGELKEFGRNFFFENFRYEDDIENLNVDFQITPTEIIPQVTGKLDALMLSNFKLGGAEFHFNDFDVTSDTAITKRGSGRVELALVLDVTGSMGSPAVSGGSGSKIADLKESVDVMLGALYGDADTDDNIKISVVPFNSQVNVGTENFDDRWLDTDGQAAYHGARFIHAEAPKDMSDFDVSFNARRTNSNGRSWGERGYNNSTGIPKLMDVNRKVNHIDLFNSNTEFGWAGCVEARPYPLDELDTPPGSTASSAEINAAISETPDDIDTDTDSGKRTDDAFDASPSLSLAVNEISNAASTRFVPAFQPDGPVCYARSGCFNMSSSGFLENDPYGPDITHRGHWFNYFYDRPSSNGHSNNEYARNNFVRDYTFATSNNGSKFFVYNDFTLGFRYALRFNHASGSYWGQIAQRFDDIGADNAGSEEYIARTAYVGLYNEANSTYNFRYDNTVTLDLASYWRQPNRECPEPIVPLTSDRTKIETAVEDLQPKGTTNSAFGTMWGWRTLSPGAPFTEGAAYDDGQWQKAIVIMTDGNNYVADSDTHWRTLYNAYGFASEERMGKGINSASEMKEQIDEKMLRICQRMKDEGILVYTIMFGLRNDTTQKLYKACATKPEAPYFHNASDGGDLSNAFGDIAADLVDLHISR